MNRQLKKRENRTEFYMMHSYKPNNMK